MRAELGAFLIKNAVSIVATAGVGTVVENIIKKTTPENVSRLNKVCIKIGSFVIGAMVSDQVEKYLDPKIDTVMNCCKALASSNKEDILIEEEYPGENVVYETSEESGE